MKLSISQAWNETSAFVKRDFGTLFILAFALVALPSVILQALAPAPTPGATPEPGLWLLLVPVVVVLSIIGSLAIAILAIGREQVIGQAISTAARRFLPLLGASILVGIAAGLLAILLLALFGGLGEGAGAAGGLALAILILTVVALCIWVRLMLMTPVAAAEDVGPIAIIRRSWELTRGHFWKLLGFVLLMVVVLVVLMMAIGAIAGILIALILGAPEPGSFGAFLVLLLSGVVNALFALYLTAMIARIYLQLAPRTSEVFE